MFKTFRLKIESHAEIISKNKSEKRFREKNLGWGFDGGFREGDMGGGFVEGEGMGGLKIMEGRGVKFYTMLFEFSIT